MAEDVFGILGTVIAGTYRVEQVIAEGGFAVVYRAHHAGFSAEVALKCLKVPQKLGAEAQAAFLAQFRAEGELLFQLSASIPNVVRPLHVDALTTADGGFVPYMVLEWLEGETLDAIVERRKKEGRPPLALKKLVRMLTPVARALERAQNFKGPKGRVSIVHRDLKPDNIFMAHVAGEEVAKILDFGIAKAHQVAAHETQGEGGAASFTPAYGAPEQWMPKRFGPTGPWTDVWGLALTMVEILAARPIIDGDQAAMMGTCLDETQRPTPRTEGLDVSDAVEAVFARALALDPRQRQPDTGVFWNELIEALDMRDGGASRSATRTPRRDRRGDSDARRPAQEPLAAPADIELDVPPFDPEAAPAQSSGVLSAARAAVAPIELEPAPSAASSNLSTAPVTRSGAADLEIDLGDLPAVDLKIQLNESDRRSDLRAPPFGPPVDPSATPAALSASLRSVPSARLGAAAASVRSTSFARSKRPVFADERPSRPRLWPGVTLIALGTILTLIDRYYAEATQQTLLPFPALWIAGPLILIGVGAVIVGLMPAFR